MRTPSLAALVVPLVFCGAAPAGHVRYRITDLGTLGGDFTEPFDVNNNGQVVGETNDAAFNFRAFLWQDGRMRDLGTLGGPEARSLGINDRGQIVGQSETGEVGRSNVGFLWDNGTMRDLGTLTPGQGFSTANAVNDAGQIVGTSALGTGEFRAVMWENGVIRDLGISQSDANDINERGDVVGTAGGRGYILRDGTVAFVPSVGGEGSTALAVNEKGQVVGQGSTADERGHAYLYNSATGQVVDLGTLDNDTDPGSSSQAHDVNNLGHVVGSSTGGSGIFLWEDGEMFDLGSLIDNPDGWDFSSANAINDKGWIVGLGDNPQGEQAGFLLTPVDGPGPTPVPLPPAAWSAVSVIGAMVMWRGAGSLRRQS
jgi:probable HAF family extracellular repeat protein